jgi:hypothetical protein
MSIAVTLALAAAGCGSSSPESAPPVAGAAPSRHAHVQVIQPTAGVQAEAAVAAGGANMGGVEVVGDPAAHAPSLSDVRRELAQLNACGGATTAAQAQPLVKSSGPGFVADPGTSQTQGQLPALTARLDALARSLRVVIYGISGYRTPAHSVAVGGFADDPHTKGQAEDIGVNSLLRSSAAQISGAQLARFGLYRPFDPSGDPNNTEVNHIQLMTGFSPAGNQLATSQYREGQICAKPAA